MLKKGNKIPEITLKDQNGRDVSLQNFKGRPLVVYFYPKDETPGCTAEACSFRDHYEEFKAAGAEVIGISRDSVASHQSFAQKRKLPFILLSDEKGQALKAFDIKTGLFGLFGRVTFIIDKEGMVTHSFESNLNIQKHIKESLKYIKKAV